MTPKHHKMWAEPEEGEALSQLHNMPNASEGHIFGYKWWSFNNGRIKSMYGGIWQPGLPKIAQREAVVTGHDPGIYGMKEPSYEDDILCSDIYGKIAMWGILVEHERGYRARYAYPVEFYYWDQDNEKDILALGETYGATVVKKEGIKPQSLWQGFWIWGPGYTTYGQDDDD